jgi:hypothetical protein
VYALSLENIVSIAEKEREGRRGFEERERESVEFCEMRNKEKVKLG